MFPVLPTHSTFNEKRRLGVQPAPLAAVARPRAAAHARPAALRSRAGPAVLPPVLELGIELLLALFIERLEVVIMGLHLPLAPVAVVMVMAHSTALMPLTALTKTALTKTTLAITTLAITALAVALLAVAALAVSALPVVALTVTALTVSALAIALVTVSTLTGTLAVAKVAWARIHSTARLPVSTATLIIIHAARAPARAVNTTAFRPVILVIFRPPGRRRPTATVIAVVVGIAAAGRPAKIRAIRAAATVVVFILLCHVTLQLLTRGAHRRARCTSRGWLFQPGLRRNVPGNWAVHVATSDRK
jgi:hypothetical protein